jgi:transposase
MAKELVTDDLWEVVEPLLPEESPKPNGGRPRIDDRAVLTGILFVLNSGIPWEMLPQEMRTCFARPRPGLKGLW